MPMQRTFLKGLILCALVGLSGCAIDWPVYQSPKLDLPPAPARKPASVYRQWWKAFADRALDGLVVAIPIAARHRAETGELGNRMGVLPVSLLLAGS